MQFLDQTKNYFGLEGGKNWKKGRSVKLGSYAYFSPTAKKLKLTMAAQKGGKGNKRFNFLLPMHFLFSFRRQRSWKIASWNSKLFPPALPTATELSESQRLLLNFHSARKKQMSAEAANFPIYRHTSSLLIKLKMTPSTFSFHACARRRENGYLLLSGSGITNGFLLG